MILINPKYHQESNTPCVAVIGYLINNELLIVKFYILLTVHLGIFLVNNQLDALFQCIFYFTSLHVSSNQVLIIRRNNCINIIWYTCIYHSV
jgi:hypothetical protein